MFGIMIFKTRWTVDRGSSVGKLSGFLKIVRPERQVDLFQMEEHIALLNGNHPLQGDDPKLGRE